MLKMFNKEKSEESERGKANQPIPWGSIIRRGVICLGLLLLSIVFVAFAVDYLRPGVPRVLSDEFSQILLFSLGLIGASATVAISLWRGEQVDAQIRKAQEQINKAQEQVKETQEQNRLAQFQNALQMATERENAGRCVSGFRILEDMYEGLSDIEKETVLSVALYVLSKNYVAFESREREQPHSSMIVNPPATLREEIKFKEGLKISSTARQEALDILIRRGFFSSKNKPIIGKDFSRLHFIRSIQDKENGLNLSEISFRNCDFFGSNLSKVDFSNSNFTGSKLYGTNISGANFTNTRSIPLQHFILMYYSERYGPAIGVYTTIASWASWKEIIRSRREANIEAIKRYFDIDSIQAGEWSYLFSLAEENADYPPSEFES